MPAFHSGLETFNCAESRQGDNESEVCFLPKLPLPPSSLPAEEKGWDNGLRAVLASSPGTLHSGPQPGCRELGMEDPHLRPAERWGVQVPLCVRSSRGRG